MILISVLMLSLSAFFSGVEIAFFSIDKVKLEIDKNKETYKSRILNYFFENNLEFITTILFLKYIALVLCCVSTNIVLNSYLNDYFQSLYYLLFFKIFLFTIIVLLIVELLPKSVFKFYPNKIFNFFCVPIWILFFFLRPIAVFGLFFSKYFLRFFFKYKLDDKLEKTNLSLDKYYSISKSSKNIEDKRVEAEMIKNVLDLSEKKLRDCMIPRTEIVAVENTASINELKEKFIETKFSKILVYKITIDNVIGYIHSSDLFKGPKTIKSVLLPIPFVPESMSVKDLLTQFIDTNKGIAIVVDEFGGTSGMVTIEDVTEEIVGEIEDEYDLETISDEQLSKDKFKFLARLDVDVVNKKYSLNLPESEEYKTIAGLILHYNEDIPSVGQVVKIENLRFTILDVKENAINEVQLDMS
tara:strand:+ start:3966 stop:5204 length:1239 start_codon:yes stop_codon:yes gene_type:complete